MRPVVAVLAIGLASGAVAGCGTTQRTDSSTGAARARADTAAILSSAQLPPGATRSAAEPSGDGGLLAHPEFAPATPNLVDAHAWWTTPGSWTATLAFLRSRHPSGAHLESTGGLSRYGAPQSGYAVYGYPDIAGILSNRQIAYTAVPLGHNRVGIRIDGEAIWFARLTASERVPHSAATLVVTYAPWGVGVASKLDDATKVATVTSRSRVDAAARLLDGLPLMQPGVGSCPMFGGPGQVLRLAFYADATSTTPVATADFFPSLAGVTLARCGGSVNLREPGSPMLALDPGLASTRFATQIASLLGVRLPVS